MKAVLNGTVLAESDATVVVEGNHYFPKESVNLDFFTPTDRSTHCPWKGDASYYDVTVNGDTFAFNGGSYIFPNLFTYVCSAAKLLLKVIK